ncbi:MAG: hypothetical protein ACJAYU_001618 [Bradymonadia bacterium]|jgi:hypothetical protein
MLKLRHCLCLLAFAALFGCDESSTGLAAGSDGGGLVDPDGSVPGRDIGGNTDPLDTDSDTTPAVDTGADVSEADAGESGRDPCNDSSDCPDGWFCNDGECFEGCTDDIECPDEQICVDTFCENVGCASADDCPDDGNPCTVNTCDAGVCGRTISEEVPVDNTVGDCQTLVCDEDGFPALIPDDSDLPPSDGIDCTAESCRDGRASYLPNHTLCEDDDEFTEHRCIPPEGCVEVDPSWACETELVVEWEDSETCGDGQDNDGNGLVDEGCSCEFGAIQRCFDGPIAARMVGGCLDGQQQCVDRGSPRWSECTGSSLPSEEICDAKDNDCDGCIDDLPDCDTALSCPTEDVTQPLRWYELNGPEILGEPGENWTWRITPPTNSATLAVEEPNAPVTRVYLDVSGDYTVSFSVVDEKGTRVACSWVIRVRGDGLRVEMRWNTFGSVDMDLHMHRAGSTAGFCTDSDCYFANCRSYARLNWGYTESDAEVCDDATGCNNPRLDIDNISLFDPENINLDNPNDGETFRVMAHMYSGSSRTDAVITIYCGGLVRAILGESPDGTGLMSSGSGCGGQTWRVADVTMSVDPDTGATDCTVDVLTSGGGWDIRNESSAY